VNCKGKAFRTLALFLLLIITFFRNFGMTLKFRLEEMKVFTRILLVFLLVIFLYLFVYPFFFDVKHLVNENPKTTALINYRIKQWEKQGKEFRMRQEWVPLQRISPYLVKAVLIAEDDKFFQHEGFDLEGIKVAMEKNLKKKEFKYGGSTISQQLAKNLFLTPRKSIVRKIHEAILTVRLEKSLSKRRILELYLNVAEWGNGIFGIEAASRYYFGKPASELSPWESALLASVLPKPLKYDPANPSPYVVNRANKILYIMQRRGIIQEEYADVEEATEDIVTNGELDENKDSTSASPVQSVSTSQDVLDSLESLPANSFTPVESESTLIQVESIGQELD